MKTREQIESEMERIKQQQMTETDESKRAEMSRQRIGLRKQLDGASDHEAFTSDQVSALNTALDLLRKRKRR